MLSDRMDTEVMLNLSFSYYGYFCYSEVEANVKG